MWNLPRPAVDDCGDHIDIAFPPAQAGAVTTADKANLLALYVRYEELKGRPKPELQGEPLGAPQLQAIHDAYEFVQDRRRLASLRASLKLLTKTCPYCGYGDIEELDHLLQKATFKAFSIFALNLIPCCGRCNRIKPKQPSEDAHEHQVHVYLEDVSMHDLLRCDVEIEPTTGAILTRYFVDRPDGMSDDLYSRLAHHLTMFQLHDRYMRQVNQFLSGLEHALDEAYESGGAEALAKYLFQTASKLQNRTGNNDWRHALLVGLANCPPFLNGGHPKALGR